MAEHWIQKAHLKKGAFTRLAEKHGNSVGEEIERDLNSNNPHVRKMAVLAKTFRNMRKGGK